MVVSFISLLGWLPRLSGSLLHPAGGHGWEEDWWMSENVEQFAPRVHLALLEKSMFLKCCNNPWIPEGQAPLSTTNFFNKYFCVIDSEFACPFCNHVSRSMKNYVNDCLLHSNEYRRAIKCPLWGCKQTLSSYTGLKAHIYWDHQEYRSESVEKLLILSPFEITV